jgi:hypothetical protein
MRLASSLGCVALALLTTACATAHSSSLPLQRVRLYETGVAYFERSGRLEGKVAQLPVPSAHLDDALKTLVVLGKDGSVDEVSFPSRQSPAVARARAGLPAEIARTLDFATVLESLRGERVEVQVGRETVRGRLFELVASEGDEQAEAALVVLTGAGAFRRIELSGVEAVRPTSAETRMRYGSVLDAGLGLRGSTRGELSVLGSLRGDVTLGYLAETPVWRGTYRLVLPTDGADPVLQGWALVHNDTAEDWNDVRVELVNGRPSSFLFPLAAPRYERRDLEIPERELSSVPQLLTTNSDAMWGDFVDEEETIGLGNVGTIGHGSGSGSGSGYGRGMGRAGTSGPTASGLLSVGSLARITEAAGEETSMMFVYSGTKPVDIAGHRSALVPFLHRPISAEFVAHFEGFGGAAEHVLRLVNTTGQTLPEGTISVFADGGFGGEAMIGRTRPQERRLLAVGPDLDTEMTVDERFSDERPQRLVFRNGTLQEHYVKTSRTQFKVRNRSGHAREVQIALAVADNARIDGVERVTYDADARRALLSFDVPARGELPETTVTVVEGLMRSTRMDQLAALRLELLAASPEIPENERRVAADAARHRADLEQATADEKKLEADMKRTEKDLERLRGHLAALGDKAVADARHPLVARLVSTEDRLEQQRRDHAALAERSERTTATLRETLSALEPPR